VFLNDVDHSCRYAAAPLIVCQREQWGVCVWPVTSVMATDIASKKEMIKNRNSELAEGKKRVEQLVREWAPEEAPPPKGCFPSIRLFSSCPLWRRQASKVATSEASTTSTIKQSGDSKLLLRMVGVRKEHTSENERIEVAMKTVKARVEGLADRVKIGRERALRAKTEGRTQDAIRELKKAKTLEKQLAAARAALDTLERQQDMIEESVLQRELATALKSTTTSVKNKSKGLLSLAESAVDESVEVRDDVDDVAAVFEGMVSTYDTGADDDDLLDELNALTSDTVGYVADEVGNSAQETPAVDVSPATGLFPSVPGLVAHAKPARAQEKKSLLKNDSASVGMSGV